LDIYFIVVKKIPKKYFVLIACKRCVAMRIDREDLPRSFNDKLDSMILVIWEYSTDKLSLIRTGAVLSSAIFIDPVNIKQINATKIHDASMSQMETCWLGCVTSQHIVCRIPEVSFDVDLWMDAKIR
jgi:hypothetical protein